MSGNKFSSRGNSASRPERANVKKPVQLSDMVEFVMKPLSEQIDNARLIVLGKIQELDSSLGIASEQIRQKLQSIDDSLNILAAQKARDLGLRTAQKRKRD